MEWVANRGLAEEAITSYASNSDSAIDVLFILLKTAFAALSALEKILSLVYSTMSFQSLEGISSMAEIDFISSRICDNWLYTLCLSFLTKSNDGFAARCTASSKEGTKDRRMSKYFLKSFLVTEVSYVHKYTKPSSIGSFFCLFRTPRTLQDNNFDSAKHVSTSGKSSFGRLDSMTEPFFIMW